MLQKASLFIDLTHKWWKSEEIPAAVLEDYPSGAALATYLLGVHMPPGTDPLDPASVLVLTTGLMAGLPYPGATRFSLVGKSPLTGCWSGGTMGGEFAWGLCRSGWWAIVIRGRALEWSYLLLDEGRVYFRPAADLIGKSFNQTRKDLQEAWGRETAVLGVGIAGEAGVHFASVSDGSAEAGLRGGQGAIFGSKRLKAMVIRPEEPVRIAHPEEFLYTVAPLLKALQPAENIPGIDLGTPGVLRKLNQAQALPVRNFQRVGFEEGWLSSVEKLKTRKRACPGCPLSCVNMFVLEEDTDSGAQQTELALFPEHLWALGPLIDINCLEDTLKTLKACMETGVDPVSLGVVAAWMAECLENGLNIGFDLKTKPGFGHGEWLSCLPEQMVTLPQVRDLLGRGVLRAAEKTGSGAIGWAVHFAGQEMTYIDPRRAFWPLSYLGPALDIKAGGKLPKEASPDEEWSLQMIQLEDRWALLETLGLCRWAAAAQENLVGNLIDACRYITGETVSAEMLNRWGQGCVNLIKAFDWREGQHPRNLRLADKFFKQDMRGSENMFAALDPEIWRRRRETYFALRGWSLEGEPKLYTTT